MNVISKSDLGSLPIFKRGKVRDVYDFGNSLLVVATDRISAFDVIMPNPVPSKGQILNSISSFWFDKTRHIIQNHLISSDVERFPEACGPFTEMLRGRSMMVRKSHALPIECIVRGYMAGSAWNEYQKSGAVCGIKLPPGLKESQRLSSPLFSPSTKAEKGHDQNITFEEVEALVGPNVASKVREAAIQVYTFAHEYALQRGIIIADTKMEFGILDGELLLIDELLTPDSSRFWPAIQYEPGRSQVSYDKQFLRDFLTASGWDKRPPAPFLPAEVIEKTALKYQQAYDQLTS